MVCSNLELLDCAKSDAYRLTFAKYDAEESLRLLRSAGEPLEFRYAAPFPLIREACQVRWQVYKKQNVHELIERDDYPRDFVPVWQLNMFVS